MGRMPGERKEVRRWASRVSRQSGTGREKGEGEARRYSWCASSLSSRKHAVSRTKGSWLGEPM